MYDPVSKRKAMKIDDILENWLWRTYEYDGSGFFPLTTTEEDQTKVEIWYQMAAYINEHKELSGFLPDPNQRNKKTRRWRFSLTSSSVVLRI